MANANTKPGKVKIIPQMTRTECAAQWKQVSIDYVTAENDVHAALTEVEKAKEAKKAAQAQIVTLAEDTAAAGFTVGDARTCEIAEAIYDTLEKLGYAKNSANQYLSRIRAYVNTGVWPEKSKRAKTGARAGKNAPDADKTGMSFDLPLKSKPETLRNKVKALAEHVRAEYKDNETMLRIAAYLADVDEA